MLHTVQTDVVVIGGGAAATMAALEAAKSGLAVVLLDKGRLGHSGATPLAGGGVATSPDLIAEILPEDGKTAGESFAADIQSSGSWICDEQLVDVLVRESREAILECLQLGVPFARKPDGSLAGRPGQGHKVIRVCHVLGGGPVLTAALARQVRQKGITVLERTAAVKLLVIDGALAGVVALDFASGAWLAVWCKATILTAGGAPALYRYTSSSQRLTGDGFALALEAGCQLANMEFVEFTLIPVVRGRPIPMGGLGPFLAHGAQLRNNQNELFMALYDPERKSLSTKALTARAVYEEMASGRGPVWMDVSQISTDQWQGLRSKSPHVVARLERAGWQLPSNDLCWIPAVHCNLGGIVIDGSGRTSIEGLFSGGECACGVHGAERMAGNALLECLVFGRVAGRSASSYAVSRPSLLREDRLAIEAVASYCSRLVAKPARDKLVGLHRELQLVAWEGLGVSRDESKLNWCSQRLEEMLACLRDTRVANYQELLKMQELENLALTGKMIAVAAKMRTESRGAHQRQDYPSRDDIHWRKWIALSARGGDLHATIQPLRRRWGKSC